MTTNTAVLRDIPGSYGTAPASRIPAPMIAAGLYDLSPGTLRHDGSRPRSLFDMTTEDGRAAHAALLADRDRAEAAKEAALERYAASQGAAEGMNGMGI